MKVDPKAIKVRKMTPEDFSAIIEVDKKVVGKERASTWPQRVTSHLQTYYAPLCHVAEVEDKIVGFIIGDMRGAEYALPLSGWIVIAGVDPDYQRSGIGRMLLEAFAEECRRNGIKTRVMVREDDEGIMKFMHSMQFRRGKLIDLER